jgi:hypothetical protein
MRLRTSCSLALLAASLTAACADPKEASEKNFARALKEGLADKTACIRFSVGQESLLDHNKRPNSRAALAEVGLLQAEQQIIDLGYSRRWITESERREHERRGTRPETAKDTVIVYSLTEEGERLSRPVAANWRNPEGREFCYGRPEAQRIIRWTEPGASMGATVTEVTYTYSLAEVPAWAEHAAVRAAYPEMEKELATRTTPAEARSVLQLTNEGWRLAH